MSTQTATNPATITIPPQLQDWRFVLIRRGQKAPFEDAWNTTANYPYNDPKLLEHLAAGGNYGALGDQDHFVIDIDNRTDNHRQEALQLLQKVKTLPPTFTVKTGRGGLHLYYKGRLEAPYRLLSPTNRNVNLGDIQGKGKQVVAPGSLHPNGQTYRTIRDTPVAELQNADTTIRTLLKEWITPKPPPRQEIETHLKDAALTPTPNLTEMIDTSTMTQQGDEYYGSHPTHGSTTGHNFWVNPDKNIWHCFRHGTGGGGWEWLAVKQGIITCEQSTPGALRGNKFRETYQAAQEQELIPPTPGKAGIAFTEAVQILKDTEFANTTEDDALLAYNPATGLWDTTAEQTIRTRAEQDLGGQATTHTKNEIIRHIKDRCTQIHRDQLNANPHLIPLANGILDTSREPYQLEPYTPQHLFTFKTPAQYDPTADPAQFTEFLAQTVTPQDAQILIEFTGYCLWRALPYHTAIMLLGDGLNGKTTFLTILTAFLGPDNVAHQALQALDNSRFAASRLDNKLANIYPDIPSQGLKATGTFKATTGGDTVDVEEKFEAPRPSKLYCKQIYSANELPATYDLTDAMMRRWRIINFPNKFVEGQPAPGEKQADPHLADKLTTPQQLSAILNQALAGLTAAKQRGGIQRNTTIQQLRERWQRESDPIQAYIDDNIQQDPDGEISQEDTFQRYCKYCAQMHRTAVKKTTFNAQFQKKTYALPSRASGRLGGKDRPRTWKGVSYVQNVQNVQTSVLRAVFQENSSINNTTRDNLDNLDKTDENPTQNTNQTHTPNQTTTTSQPTTQNHILQKFQTWLQNRAHATIPEAAAWLKNQGLDPETINRILYELHHAGRIYQPKPGQIAWAD